MDHVAAAELDMFVTTAKRCRTGCQHSRLPGPRPGPQPYPGPFFEALGRQSAGRQIFQCGAFRPGTASTSAAGSG